MKKVKIITKIDKLGAGLSIASSDLSLRGAGNIIGAEQSGHIKEVGIELYYKMVQESINEIQNVVSVSEKWSPQISLGFSINIGDEFIEDSNQRLALYREISEIDNVEKLRTISESLKNKYGNLPLNFLNLLFLIEIKIMAKGVVNKNR